MERIFLIINWLDVLAQIGLMVVGVLAARRWGGPAAQIGAIINVIAFAITLPVSLLPLPDTQRMWAVCSLDLLTCAGFLYPAARYNSLWLSVAVLAQGVQAALDVIYIGEGSSFDRIHHFLFGAFEDSFTWAIQVAILGAALADRRRLAPEAHVRV